MKYLSVILFLGLSISINAQQKISGVITNTSNIPLMGVEVYVAELQKGTSTDENGYYQINNLPNSTLVLTVSYLGYETQSKRINLSTTENEFNFVLRESVFKMEEIIISTPFNKLQSENVMKVEKATIQQLKNKGSATLVDGISTIPGVSQVSTGIGIGKPVIRGLRGNRVLVYNQGVRLENQQFGDEHGLGITESSIESVEVIKGPASLLYGSDALGGVLFFNPVKYAEDNTFDFSYDQSFFSNTIGSSTNFSAKKSFDSWKFLAVGSYNQHSDYEIPTGERVTNTRFNETLFNAGIAYNSKLISSDLRFGFNHTKVGIPEEIEEQSKNKSIEIPYQDLTTKMVSLNSSLFLKNSKITAVLGFTENVRKEFEGHHHEHGEDDHHDDDDHHDEEHDEHDEHEDEIVEAALDLNLKTYSYDVKWHLPKSEKFETVLGFQGLSQKNRNFGEEILIPNADIQDFGAFITSTLFINKNMLLAGIRFDTRKIETEEHIVLHDEEEHVFEPINRSFENVTASLGYKTTLFKHIVTRLNVASGFKAPNLAELTSNGVHHGSNRFEIGNSNLKSEKNIQTDIALEYKDDHFELFVNGFYNHINNYIFISPTGEMEEDFFVYEYTQDNSKLYGGEIGTHLHPHPLDWLHLYTSYEFVIGEQNNGDYLPLIPANKLTNTLRTEFDIKKWLVNGFASITLENNFKQNKVSMFETPTKGYSLLNIGIGGTFNLKKSTIDLNLNVNNLLDKSYISHLSRLKANNIYNMGRNLVTSVKFNF